MCWITDGSSDSLGDRALCPGDPAPPKNPDGSDNITGDLISTYCKFGQGGPLPIQFLTRAVCLGYSTATMGQDVLADNMAGLNMLCDTLFAGACTAFELLNSGALDDPGCTDPPDNPGLCSLAGPGK